MKKWQTLAVLLLHFGFGTAQDPVQEKVDFSGIDRFWNIVDIIESGKLPTESDWDGLFKCMAYSYLAKEAGEETVISRFLLAFAPAKSAERQEILALGNYDSRILDHLIRAERNREAITTYVDSLKSQKIVEKSLLSTAKYLPEGFIEDHPDLKPDVAFAIFEPDGKASNEIIVMDVAFAMGIDLNLFLAHEAHHFFMGEIRKQMQPAGEQIEYVLRSLRQLHLEGIADLIDKRGILQLPENLTEAEDWYGFHYREYYRQSRSTFARIDSLIPEVRTQGSDAGREIWNTLHFGTHPEALHMAKLIEDTFGRPHIIGILDNPFEFLRSYQKAAKSHPSRGWVFSEGTMAVLRDLEREYLID